MPLPFFVLCISFTLYCMALHFAVFYAYIRLPRHSSVERHKHTQTSSEPCRSLLCAVKQRKNSNVLSKRDMQTTKFISYVIIYDITILYMTNHAHMLSTFWAPLRSIRAFKLLPGPPSHFFLDTSLQSRMGSGRPQRSHLEKHLRHDTTGAASKCLLARRKA